MTRSVLSVFERNSCLCKPIVAMSGYCIASILSYLILKVTYNQLSCMHLLSSSKLLQHPLCCACKTQNFKIAQAVEHQYAYVVCADQAKSYSHRLVLGHSALPSSVWFGSWLLCSLHRFSCRCRQVQNDG